MGLFDMFKKKAEPATAAAPSSISASAGADVLCSPVKGKVIKMADVPDPVFGGEVLGKGCAVWPEGDLVYAPCDGKVTVTMGHAVGLQSDSGIEVLVHVGVDTVNMNGDGFEGFVKAQDRPRQDRRCRLQGLRRRCCVQHRRVCRCRARRRGRLRCRRR